MPMSHEHYMRVVAAIGGSPRPDQELVELVELQASIIKSLRGTVEALERTAEAKEDIITTLEKQLAMYQQSVAGLAVRITALGK
jgi:hypothetical protein